MGDPSAGPPPPPAACLTKSHACAYAYVFLKYSLKTLIVCFFLYLCKWLFPPPPPPPPRSRICDSQTLQLWGESDWLKTFWDTPTTEIIAHYIILLDYRNAQGAYRFKNMRLRVYIRRWIVGALAYVRTTRYLLGVF